MSAIESMGIGFTALWRRFPAPAAGLLVMLTAVVGGCTPPGGVDDGVLLRPGGDILVAHGTVDLSEDVTGDVMAAGRDIRFVGTVGGSYLGAGADQVISGRIDGSIRAAGASVRVDAAVGRNVTIVGEEVRIASEGVVDGNAYLAGGTVTLDGRIGGDAYIGAGDVLLNGVVDGDVRVEAGSLRFGPDAAIGGELRVRLPEEAATIAVDDRARVAGGVVSLTPREERHFDDAPMVLLRLVAFLLAGVAVVALLPGTSMNAADEIRTRGAASMGFGLLAVLLIPLVVLALAVTVVGIPLALTVGGLYLLFLYMAPVIPGVWLGGEILRGRASEDRGDMVLVFLAGGAIVAVALVLPWVGLLARALATCIGFGAVVLLVRDRDAGPGLGG